MTTPRGERDPRWARLLTLGPLTGNARWMALAAAAFVLPGIGALDRVTPFRLVVFYGLPPVIATVLVGTWAGLLLSADAALVWALSPPVDTAPALGLLAVDVLLRFVGVSAIVALVAALRAAVLGARASDRRSRDFLALAAHQLRTPVAGLQSSAEALIGLGSTPAQERLLANVAAESARIGRLVSALLESARLDEGRPLAVAPTDVTGLCREEVRRVREQTPTLAVELVADQVDAVTSAEACGSIVANLLDNARRHAETRVDLEVTREASGFRITARDDGPGVPAGCEELIFERFVSLDNRGGAGLGLALSRAFARRLGGDLVYRRGRFVLTLPAAAAPATPVPAMPAPVQRHRADT